MVDITALGSIFGRMAQGLRLIENTERKEVIRCLRSMYFYSDRVLSSLRYLIETKGAGYQKAINDAVPFLPDVEEARKAIEFISTPSVQSNLSISLEDVAKLRELSDFKTGIRGTLNAIFFAGALKDDPDLVLKLAKTAYEDILYLNKQIEELERSLMG